MSCNCIVDSLIARSTGNIRCNCIDAHTDNSLRYRRGKLESNDVDIVISHSNLKSGGDQIKGLCKELVKRLYEKGTARIVGLFYFFPSNTSS